MRILTLVCLLLSCSFICGCTVSNGEGEVSKEIPGDSETPLVSEVSPDEPFTPTGHEDPRPDVAALPDESMQTDAGVQDTMPPESLVQPKMLAIVKWPTALAVDATHVYWAGYGGVIGRVSLSTPTPPHQPEILVAGNPKGENPIFHLRLDATHLYWLERKTGVLRKREKTSGSPAVLANLSVNTDLGGFAINQTHLYYAYQGKCYQLPKAGGTPKKFSDYGGTGGLAIDAQYLYLTSAGTQLSDSILKLSLQTQKLDRVSSSLASDPAQIKADDDTLYWLGNAGKGLFAVSKAGGTPRQLATFSSAMTSFALGKTHIFAVSFLGGDVVKVSKAGGTVEIVAAQQSKPTVVIANDTLVFWGVKGNGAIFQKR